jgi:regulation of enolase protein 1 (concanavalin A-like superfamily)
MALQPGRWNPDKLRRTDRFVVRIAAVQTMILRMMSPRFPAAPACAFCILLSAFSTTQAVPIAARVSHHSAPAIFQAWNPIDMPDQFPVDTVEGRLKAAAKHDLLWEEPVSQLGYGVQLALGAVWDHEHGGLADQFTDATLKQALANRAAMLAMNPNMVFLFEVRWRDAPGSFLPEDSPFWKRHPDGRRVMGWDGGPEPYYMLNYEHAGFQDNVARQCQYAIASGVYDGVMLDWSGHLEIIRRVRAAIGEQGLIIVNIHDDIHDGEKYQDYINGSFMECNPQGPGQPAGGGNGTTWDKLRAGLKWFEGHLREPRINCLEVWGARNDLRRMRATTTLGLVYSDGYLLYADPNPLPTPDHLHDWYPFWDVKLGEPLGRGAEQSDGSARREFEAGTVVYNHYQNRPVKIGFSEDRKRLSDGAVGREFTVQDADGDVFLKDLSIAVQAPGTSSVTGSDGPVAPKWEATRDFSSPALDTSKSSVNESSPGDLEVTQSGGWGIWNTNDVFGFTWLQVTNDFDIRVRVASLKFAAPWTKAGLMARKELSSDSAHLSVLIQAGVDGNSKEGSAMRPVSPQRISTGGESSFTYDYEETTVPPEPVWLRMTRVGAEFTGYHSADGKMWSRFCGETRADLRGRVYLGVATAATDGDRGTVARYEEMSLRTP